MSDLLAMAELNDSLREGPEAWTNRCSHCTKKAETTIKLGSWRTDGFERLHRWIAGGRAECGLKAKR